MAAPPAAVALVGLALVATASAATGAAPAPAPCFIDPVWTVPEIVNVSGCTGGSSRCAWTVPANRTNIQYGSAYNRGKRKQEPLLLDLYLPPSTDTRTKRPSMAVASRAATRRATALAPALRRTWPRRWRSAAS